jgi:hypothetical protein
MALHWTPIWRREASFQGWACPNCEWRYSNTRPFNAFQPFPKDMLAEFNAHKCKDHPRPKVLRKGSGIGAQLD